MLNLIAVNIVRYIAVRRSEVAHVRKRLAAQESAKTTSLWCVGSLTKRISLHRAVVDCWQVIGRGVDPSLGCKTEILP